MFLSRFLRRIHNFFHYIITKNEIFYSESNGKISTGTSFGKKALFAGNIPQSGGEFISMWKHVITHVSKRNIRPKNILLLGVAGGTVLRYVQKFYPESKIIGIDIDSIIIGYAKKYFDLKETSKTSIVIDDAVSWIKKYKGNKTFSIIIVDLFIGALNPPKTRSRAFLRNLNMILQDHGIVIYNADYQDEDHKKYDKFRKLCASEIGTVEPIFSFKLNRVLLLTKAPSKSGKSMK